MAKEFSRTSRLGEQIQRDLASLIQLEMKNPNLGMVTINHVKLSKDLSYADVYFTVMGAKGESDEIIIKQTESILTEAAGFLRSQLAKGVTARTTPMLRFHYDVSINRGRHLTDLIYQARKADDERNQDES